MTFLAHPIDGLVGLKEAVSSRTALEQLGSSVVNALSAKIDRMSVALTQGGDQNAEQLGKDLGDLIYQVGSVVTGVGGIVKAGVVLAKIGVTVGSGTLKVMAAKSAAVIADIKTGGALPGAAKSVEELNAATNAGKSGAYVSKPAPVYTVAVIDSKNAKAIPKSVVKNIINESTAVQLDQAISNLILSIEKGMRPDPSTYLTPSYIAEHLAKFDNGASRFMTEDNLNKYGIGQRDGTSFVMPSREATSLLESTSGNARTLEKALGLPENFLESNKLVRIDIPKVRELNLRIPSGNEAGANDFWMPGGKLPNGNLEAVLDTGGLSKEYHNIVPVPSIKK